jgi:hypothetical protein
VLPQNYESKSTPIYEQKARPSMVMEIKLGDVVRLKKKHPCGSYEWEVVRLGADIGIKCLKCQRRVLLERSVFKRKVKEVISEQQ